MTRFAPGIYQIINRSSGTGNTLKYYLDNERMELGPDSTIIVVAFDNISIANLGASGISFCNKVGSIKDSVIGSTGLYSV